MHPARALVVAMLLAAGACAPAPKPPAPEPSAGAERPAAPPAEAPLTLTWVDFTRLPGWRGDRQSAAIPALLHSCARIRGKDDGAPLDAGAAGAIGGSAGSWRAICAEAATLKAGDDDGARSFFERRFRPALASAGGRAEGLFTGYYEIELRGAWLRGGPYQTPIYQRPPDLVEADLGGFSPDLEGRRLTGWVIGGRFRPYPDRAEIEAGALAGRGLELLWLENPIDAFFLHVQGSGRVWMDDGTLVRIGFAGRNGHPYTAIGRSLIAAGEIPAERLSMQSIRAWLTNHADRARALMAENRSFIFFRIVDGAARSLDPSLGPVGAQGAPLSAGRSLAVDRRHVPLGLPVWLDTTDPAVPGQPLQRLMIAQDTGAAIRGAVRGDVFWGFGEEAAMRAGLMKQPGRYFLLLPRP